MAELSKQQRVRRSKLITMGIVVTVLWIIGGLALLFQNGVSGFLNQGLDALGGFLEGFFAPLAFLWLVIGLFMQQRELSLNTDVLRATVDTAKQQTRVLEETELRARQSAFFQIAENVKRQTRNLAGLIAGLILDESGNAVFSEEDMLDHWMDHQRGQYEKFPAMLINPSNPMSTYGISEFEMLFGNEALCIYSEEYIRSFRQLLRMGHDCDPDGTIVKTVSQTPHGSLFDMMIANIAQPSCWVLLDDPGRPSTASEVSFLGNWTIETTNEKDNDVTQIEIWKTEGGFGATVSNGEGEITMNTVEIHESAMFIRCAWFVATATIREETLKGSFDLRDGSYATFVGSRIER